MSDQHATPLCGIILADGSGCAEPVEPGAPVNLCTRHLLVAYDWVASDVGLTDVLPSPCLACGSRLGVRYPSGWLCAICEWKVGDLPDRDAVGARVDVVYYLRLGDRIKIGTSGNPRGRFVSLPHDEVLAFERGNRELEHRRHTQFASHRLAHTEWFAAHEELLRHIQKLRAGVEDPWSQYARWVSEELALHG